MLLLHAHLSSRLQAAAGHHRLLLAVSWRLYKPACRYTRGFRHERLQGLVQPGAPVYSPAAAMRQAALAATGAL